MNLQAPTLSPIVDSTPGLLPFDDSAPPTVVVGSPILNLVEVNTTSGDGGRDLVVSAQTLPTYVQVFSITNGADGAQEAADWPSWLTLAQGKQLKDGCHKMDNSHEELEKIQARSFY
ncbi:hypothetical protein E3N88_34840 [Mikania micrantha]|uniref:Uncharacterized protein n=1 Tax=Mikania micrantha TaxID=192012 RepID=A0A5N6LZA3_9ASTR|nr:hypothetical protein E3N88_34840 [Mikania micrantha]